MSGDQDDSIQIFIGQPITHSSEEAFLRAVHRFFRKRNLRALVLANFELAARQFDFLIVTEFKVIIVEVKSSFFAVRGGINGPWEYATASGRWAAVTNGYDQALQRKNALANAMKGIPRGFYPDAHVVFVGGIPAGSDLTAGNFKVQVSDLPALLDTLSATGANPWSFAEWRSWALANGLRHASLEASFDKAPANIIQQYQEAFLDDYGPQSLEWIEPDTEQSAAVSSLLSPGSSGIFATGPSGCGKTLLAKAVAVDLARTGTAVFFIQAKAIDVSLAETLRTEVGLVADLNSAKLLRAIRQVSVPACFVLDGLNELSGLKAEKTLRGVKTLAKRYGARLIVTSQDPNPAALQGLATLAVKEPTLELKQKIAAARGTTLSPEAIEMLGAVRSGLEAKLVGELHGDLGGHATRSSIVDQYIRQRLGAKARTGYSALRSLAVQLFSQLAYSVTETSFDSFMIENGLDDGQCDALLSSGLLDRRGGRISFIHEIFLMACAAQSFALIASTETERVSKTLNTAFAEGLAPYVLAAVDDEHTAREILISLLNPEILAKTAIGGSGSIARSAAMKILEEASDEILADIACLSLKLSADKGVITVGWKEIPGHSPEKMARFAALGIAAKHGVEVDTYLRLCRAMDARLLSERQRLAEQAREYNVGLRSLSFGLAYLGLYSGRDLSFLRMVRASHSFFENVGQCDAMRAKTLEELTSGELHFVVEHRYLLYSGHESAFCEQLAQVIETRFRREPYHVQLTILHAAGFASKASDDALAKLVAAIRRLDTNSFHIFISTSVVEALKLLGALEEDAEEAREGIREHLQEALASDDGEDAFEKALSVYIAQFDHPYNGIYCEEINALTSIDKKRLVTRAFQAESIRHSLSLRWLAVELADWDDPMDAYLFARFATCPEINPHWQDEVGTFVLSTRFLSRHGIALPDGPKEDDRQICFAHLRDIVAYVEKPSAMHQHTVTCAWENLSKIPSSIAVGLLHDVIHEGLSQRLPAEETKRYPPVDFTYIFRSELLGMARRFARRGEEALSGHGHGHEQASAWALELIGELGDRGDLGTLRKLAEKATFAKAATRAIRTIETRC